MKDRVFILRDANGEKRTNMGEVADYWRLHGAELVKVEESCIEPDC